MKQKGQGMVEYVIILSFVALVVIAVMRLLGPSVQSATTQSINPTAVTANQEVANQQTASDLVTAVVKSHYESQCSTEHTVTLAVEKSRSQSENSYTYTYYVYENNTSLGEVTLTYYKDSTGNVTNSSTLCPGVTPTPLP